MFFFACVIVSASAFAPALKTTFARPLFLFKKSGGSSGGNKGWKVGEGSANNARLGGYVPDGLTAEQYAKQLAAEKTKAAAQKKKFKIGKEVETLTEWQIAQTKNFGSKGADIRKGHRLVKAKYEEFYAKEDIDRVNRGQ